MLPEVSNESFSEWLARTEGVIGRLLGITNDMPPNTFRATEPPVNIETLIRTLQREMEGMRGAERDFRTRMEMKLDSLLTNRVSEAERMGELQSDMRTLTNTVGKQGADITALRDKLDIAREVPRDYLLRGLLEVGKLAAAGVVGFFSTKLHHS